MEKKNNFILFFLVSMTQNSTIGHYTMPKLVSSFYSSPAHFRYRQFWGVRVVKYRKIRNMAFSDTFGDLLYENVHIITKMNGLNSNMITHINASELWKAFISNM